MNLAVVVSLAADDLLRGWGVAAALDDAELSTLDHARLRVWAKAIRSAGPRIHPTARVSPHAVVGHDVIIGPGCVIHEFATVRDHSILASGVEVGHGCEVTRCVLASGTRLAHQVVLADAVVGRGVHLSAAVVLGSVHLWNDDMTRPQRPITIRVDRTTRYSCQRPKFGGALGDHVRVGMGALLGPGLLVGAGSILYPRITASEQLIPAGSVVRPDRQHLRIEPRRDHPAGGATDQRRLTPRLGAAAHVS